MTSAIMATLKTKLQMAVVKINLDDYRDENKYHLKFVRP